MLRWLPFGILACGLLIGGTACARPGTAELAAKLKSPADFRIRVQAALELGRSEDKSALGPLIAALDDENASVRAAAAAALKMRGDASALAALKQHRLDRSEPVRAQVYDAIRVIESRSASATPDADTTPKVFVKMGGIRNGTAVKSPAIERAILSESRKNLDSLPGVDVLPNDDEVVAAAGKQDIPVVMVTTSIQKLSAARAGREVVYSANIEYLVHTMPDEAILARVAGSASTSASEVEARDKTKSAELRREVLEAAVRSALQRASAALLAAARM